MSFIPPQRSHAAILQLMLKPLCIFILFTRIYSAFNNCVTNSDEIYDYWENVSFLTHKHGLQTWQYSPEYGLRTYVFTQLIRFMSAPFAYVAEIPMLQFFIIRLIYTLCVYMCEMVFLNALVKFWSVSMCVCVGICMAVCPGLYIASSQLLPSSAFMACMYLVCAALLSRNTLICVLICVSSTMVLLPFGVLMYVPVCACLCVQTRVQKVGRYALISAAVVLPVMLLVDYLHYGRFVFFTYNSLVHSLFNSNGLFFGTEAWTFYLKNLLLNFNMLLPMAVIGACLCVKNACGSLQWRLLGVGMIVPAAVWILFMQLDSHKKSTFLYPVYPCVTVLAGVCVHEALTYILHTFSIKSKDDDISCDAIERMETSRKFLWLSLLSVLCVCALLFFMRVSAIYTYYTRPVFAVWESVAKLPVHRSRPTRICLGREWYNYPSSFFLPEDAEVYFVRSDFKGLLPKPYRQSDSMPKRMNNRNVEDPSQYLPLEQCDYLVDTANEAWRPKKKAKRANANYHPHKSLLHGHGPHHRAPTRLTGADFHVVKCTRMLDAQNSKFLLRDFLIPYVSVRYNSYNAYCLWEVY